MTPGQPKLSGTRNATARNKRDGILRVATECFGRDGYEETKWADVATAVGVGSTALYHYFESKQHCLFVIMAESIEFYSTEFQRLTQGTEFRDGITTVLRSGFDLSEYEVHRNRLTVEQQGRLAHRCDSGREEEARRSARAHTRQLETMWTSHLSRGMGERAIPELDPQLLSRAILGLYNSIWHWYRPGGILTLEDISEFYMERLLSMIGFDVERGQG